MRTSTSVGPIAGRGTSSTSTGPAADRLHDLLHDVPSPPAPPGTRLQVVVTPTGRAASIRQVSTGASVVLPNPAATGLVLTVMQHRGGGRYGHRDGTGRAGDERRAAGDPDRRVRPPAASG